jgi:hypothetical protein
MDRAVLPTRIPFWTALVWLRQTYIQLASVAAVATGPMACAPRRPAPPEVSAALRRRSRGQGAAGHTIALATDDNIQSFRCYPSLGCFGRPPLRVRRSSVPRPAPRLLSGRAVQLSVRKRGAPCPIPFRPTPQWNQQVSMNPQRRAQRRRSAQEKPQSAQRAQR